MIKKKEKKRIKRYKFKKTFVSFIERRTIRRLLVLSKKDAIDFLWNVPPLKKGDKLLKPSENLNDSLVLFGDRTDDNILSLKK